MTRWDVLINLIEKHGYNRIGEVGVHRGTTAKKILERCEIEAYFMVEPGFPISKNRETLRQLSESKLEHIRGAAQASDGMVCRAYAKNLDDGSHWSWCHCPWW